MDVQTVKNNYIESHIQEKVNVSNEFNNDNENISKENVNDKPIQINYKEYHSKMNYNKLLSNKKYYLMMVGNFLSIGMFLLRLFLSIEKSYHQKNHKINLESLRQNFNSMLIIKIFLIYIIITTIIMIILLYDFNKYKKVKNSNDINQYKQYIIDDNNIDQLTKQRRYNFINGLFIGKIIINILFFISFLYIDYQKLQLVNYKVKMYINIIFNILICILLIIYIIYLIIDKNILFDSLFFIVFLFFIFYFRKIFYKIINFIN